jgi:hypothetical protein
MTFTRWNDRQPDNAGGREHYLQICHNGKWNDGVENSKTVVGYICEWKNK